jgi:transmembrane sensor
LGPASRLRVGAEYGRHDRAVGLDGEAFFTVAHDADRPFMVRAGATVARDIGTAFTVRRYSGEPVRVAVAEGVVGIGAMQLRRGDVATVDGVNTTVVRGTPLGPYVAWVQGGLVFDATPLRQAVADLSRMYDLEIVVADSGLLAEPITATIDAEPVDDVLRAVTFVIGARYERVGRRVVIRRAIAPARILPSRHEPLLRIASEGGH